MASVSCSPLSHEIQMEDQPELSGGWRSMLVVVAIVGGVPVPVVYVVQMVAVQDRRVATTVAVHMGVRLGHNVRLARAFVVMVPVTPVHMPVMEIVDMVTVSHLNMTTVLTVLMIVRLRRRVLAGRTLVVMPLVGVVLVPVMQIVDMPGMLNGGVPAVRAVDVGVLRVNWVFQGAHQF
ncbi:hypothetical protein [Dactylosporangium sp. CA-139066]|uniref:hypothetical protein n=1 Tax=Dactylosporangium sp. CA-139066 TaxID=3239930 RepID=UPI003D8DA6C0